MARLRSPSSWCAIVLAASFVLAPRFLSADETAAPIAPAAVRSPLPGLISAPPPLPGNRRWQILTKNLKGLVGDIAWSPDSRWLALATGRVVRLYDVSPAPELQRVLFGHNDFVHAVRFSPDGMWIATASQDGTVRIWDAAGSEKSIYSEHEDAVRDVSWHPDGTRLASASLDGTVRIWSLDGKTIAVLADHEAPVNAVAWNPDGKLLASGCLNKVIRFWSAEGRPGPVLDAHLGSVRSLAWNSDGTKLLSGDQGRESTDANNNTIAHLKVWDTAGKLLNSASVNVPINQVCWNPEGTHALGGGFFAAWLWPLADRKPVVNIGGASNFTAVAWRPNGEMIAIGIRLSRIDGSVAYTLPVRTADVGAIDQSPDGNLIAVGCADSTFHIFDRDGKQVQHSQSIEQGPLAVVRWSSDGRTLIPCARIAAQLQRYNSEANSVGDPINLSVRGVRSLDWSRDGRFVVTGGDGMIPQLVDLQTSTVTALGRQAHGITQVRFTADEHELCSAGFDGCVRFWTRDGKPGRLFEAVSAPIRGLALTSDGKTMATGHEDNTVRIWSLEDGKVDFLGGHGGFVQCLDFNPDNSLLASGSWDQTVRIWKREGAPVTALRGHEGSVFAVQWTRDGRQILSGATDGTMRLWNAQSEQADWVVLFGDTSGYVTLDSHGRVKHGDEMVLENDFVVFADNDQGVLARVNWADIRTAIQPQAESPTKAP